MSGPLRIAYVINSLEGGGASAPVPAILSTLRDAGAETALFALTPRDRRGEAAIRAAGFAVTVRQGGERDHLAAARWLDAALAAWRPTHLWTSLTRATLVGLVVARRRGWPVVSWQHAAYLKPGNRRLLRLLRGWPRLWVGDSQAVTRLTAERLGVPPDRLVTWPIFRADPHAPVARPWAPGAPVRIGSLGRLHPVKGYDVLIAALGRLHGADLPRHELVIAGEGAERAALTARIAALGLEGVRLPGYADAPAAFLAERHLYVQPSRSEGFCIGAHEAMQAGLPVLASAVGELPNSIVAGETGAVVPPGDPAALAAALAGLLGRPERLAEMGAQGRARVLDRFGPDRFAATGHAIVERLRAGR